MLVYNTLFTIIFHVETNMANKTSAYYETKFRFGRKIYYITKIKVI